MLARASEVCEMLDNYGIDAQIIELPTIYPLCSSAILAAAKKNGAAAVIEDNIKSGGLGEHIGALLIENGIKCSFKSFAYPLVPIEHGSVDELDTKYELDAKSITDTIRNMITNIGER